MAPADLWLPISSVGCESGISPARGLTPVHSGQAVSQTSAQVKTSTHSSCQAPSPAAPRGLGRGGQVRLATFSQHHVDGLDLALTPLQCMMRSFPNVKDELHR